MKRSSRPSLNGAAWRTIKTIHTTKTGRFSYRTRPGSSRNVRIRYEGTLTVRASHADVTLRVAASTSLHASRRRLRNGQRVRFSGTVKGTHVKTGKLVQLQTPVNGHWQTFATAHTTKRARWSRSYRFTGTKGRYIYAFRALVPAERGYPYRTGHSKSVHVVVTGP